MPIGLRFLSPGYVIEDKYSIVQAIGSGGMGIVYEATDTRLGHRVAVKVLQPDLVHHGDAVARFRREARAAAQLRSVHVAHVFDVGALPDETPYIVMEFLEGRDLAAEMAERGPLPVKVAIDYLLQVCDAMAEAHHLGIVHRDLKPANMFLVSAGRGPVVKVLDFGISKISDGAAPSVTTTRTGLGTAAYMSPEQVQSAKHVDSRTDVWALGVVLYEMLSGSHPFAGETARTILTAIVADDPVPLRRVREDVPRELDRIVATALEKNRERRFRDAAELAVALAPYGSAHLGRGPAPTARHAAPTLKSGPADRMMEDQPNSGSAGSAHGSPPPWAGEFAHGSARDETKSSRPRSVAWMSALVVAAISSIVLVLEMSRESGPRGQPQPSAPPSFEASSVAPPTTAAAQQTGQGGGEPATAGETMSARDPPSTKAPTTASSTERQAVKPVGGSNAVTGTLTPDGAVNKSTQHTPATRSSAPPPTRKNTLGLPDDPG